MSSILRRRRIMQRLALMSLLCIFWSFTCLAAARSEQPAAAILYYSNETTRDVLQTDNYKKILRLLAQSGSKSAGEIREALIEDAQHSDQVVARDIESLKRASRRAGVWLFAFSNSLALKGQYLSFNPDSETAISKPLLVNSAEDNSLLKLAPLSLDSSLQSAFQSVLLELPERPIQIIFILNGHGSSGIPLMPRVNIDFTRFSDDELLRALDDVAHDDLQLPETVLQGTSQTALWRILGEISIPNKITFPLVFLSSCESGPLSVSDVFAIPNSVQLVIHSGTHGMSSEAINYERIFNGRHEGTQGIGSAKEQLVKGLLDSEQGLSRDTVLTAWRWPIIAFMEQLPLWTYVLPLFVWTLWVVFWLLGSFPRSSHKVANGGATRRESQSEPAL
jgi:hypothetical protein